jgi:hypothetical protein
MTSRELVLNTLEFTDIRGAVKMVRDTLWENGGCIAQCEFGAGAKPENVRAMFAAWDEFTGNS